MGPSRNGAKLGCRNQYGHRYALVLDTDISGAFDPVGVVSGPFDPAGVAAVTPGRVGLVNDLGPPTQGAVLVRRKKPHRSGRCGRPRAPRG